MLVRTGVAPFAARVRPPGSKSLTNRALLLAGLAEGESTLRHALTEADDAQRMIAALGALGAKVELSDDGEIVRITGVGGRWKPGDESEVRLDLGNAGTATRFLAAASVLSPVPVVIDGNARMRERPIGELAEALLALGARIESLAEPGYPPIRVMPMEGEPGRELRFGKTRSSQFLSAVLLTAPWFPGGLTLRLDAEPTSRPYLEMTIALLIEVGACVRSTEDLRVVRVSASESRRAAGGLGVDAFDLTIEPDASGATYFWAAAAMAPGATCRVLGVGARSLQGDSDFGDVLSRMGARVSYSADGSPEEWIEVGGAPRIGPVMADMAAMPDAAMTLASVCAFAEGTSIIRGLRTLRDKETDRIAAMQAELAKVGVEVTASTLGDGDTITITPPKGGIDCSTSAPRVEFDTYDDHRMAMSLALIGLRRPNTFVRDPGCVRKTYPGFWRELGALQG